MIRFNPQVRLKHMIAAGFMTSGAQVTYSRATRAIAKGRGQPHSRTDAVGAHWALRALGAGIEGVRPQRALGADVPGADLPCIAKHTVSRTRKGAR